MQCIEVVAGLLVRDDCILVQQRPAHKHQGGLWEFPGGKMDPGETQFQALERELAEELGLTSLSGIHFHTEDHRYDDLRVILHFWLVNEFTNEPWPQEDQPLLWQPIQELPDLPMPAADVPVVHRIRSELSA